MPPHWAVAYGKAWQEIWGTGPDQGLGKLRREHEEEGPMGDIVKNRLTQEGGPDCGVTGIPRYRGGVGANPSDVWIFAGLQHTQQAPHTTRLVKQWMEFLKNNRPPREWCRSVPGTGFLHEEGYGSTVLYRKGTNAPQWLQNQADQFTRMVRHFDDKANNGGDSDVYGTTVRNYKDAADIVTQPRGAESNLTGFFGGRFGRGGPGSNAQDVLDLLERHIRRPDANAFVLDYVGTLDPAITPFDITITSRGPISRSNHEWFETLTPAYDLMIYDMNAYIRSAGVRPSGLARLQRIRQQLDLPDGVRLPGRVRSLRGAPGVPPLDLREWLTREGVRARSDGNVPPYYNSSTAYLHLVVNTWRHIPGFIRRSGGCPSARDHHTNCMN